MQRRARRQPLAHLRSGAQRQQLRARARRARLQEMLGLQVAGQGGCNATAATKAGCTNAEIGSWCAVKSDDEFSGQAASVDDLQKARGSAATRGASAAAATKSTKLGCFQMTIE